MKEKWKNNKIKKKYLNGLRESFNIFLNIR